MALVSVATTQPAAAGTLGILTGSSLATGTQAAFHGDGKRCSGFVGWSGSTLTATTDGKGYCASYTWSAAQNLTSATSLTASFQYSISATGTKADGIVFAVQSSGATAIGGYGANLGYSGTTAGKPGIYSGFGIGFDSYHQRILFCQNGSCTAGVINESATQALIGHAVVISVSRRPGSTTGILKLGLDGRSPKRVGRVNWPTSATSWLGFTGATGGSTQTTSISNIYISWAN